MREPGVKQLARGLARAQGSERSWLFPPQALRSVAEVGQVQTCGRFIICTERASQLLRLHVCFCKKVKGVLGASPPTLPSSSSTTSSLAEKRWLWYKKVEHLNQVHCHTGVFLLRCPCVPHSTDSPASFFDTRFWSSSPRAQHSPCLLTRSSLALTATSTEAWQAHTVVLTTPVIHTLASVLAG